MKLTAFCSATRNSSEAKARCVWALSNEGGMKENNVQMCVCVCVCVCVRVRVGLHTYDIHART